MDIEREIIELKERIEKLEKLILGETPKEKEKPIEKITSARDKTKYIFEGKILPKNRLVLKIVEKFVNDNKPTLEELKKAFDKSLQGSLGVVACLADAEKISDGAKRFFMKDDEIILLVDGNRVVVCTQWGAFNIKNFIKQASNLGYLIEEI